MKLSVIIVNYNVAGDVDICLSSISRVLKGIDYEIIVIDNNSTDRDIEKVSEKHKGIRFEFLKDNIGFGAANNYGAGISRGEYILLLNPDTIVTEDFINPIIDFIEKNNEAGACGPMLKYPDGRYQYSCGPQMGLLYETAEALMFIKLFRYIFRRFYLNRYADNPVKVGWLSAACMIIKKDVFTKTGGFDKDYFLNYEDIDLCRKINEMGLENYYFPAYSCIHSDHSSQKKNYEVLVFSRYQSRRIFSRKYYGFFKRLCINMIHLSGIILRLAVTGIMYKNTERKQRMKGYIKSLKLYTGV